MMLLSTWSIWMMHSLLSSVKKRDVSSARNMENEFQSVAQSLFKDHQVLTKRPEGMTFNEYKFLRYTQDLVLKRMFRQCPKRELMGIIPNQTFYNTKRHRNAVNV